MDSAVSAAEAIAAGYELYALTLSYGQRHSVEVQRASEVAREVGVAEHRLLELGLGAIAVSSLTDPAAALPEGRAVTEIGCGVPSTYVPARNTVFLSLALAWAETLAAEAIYIGANVTDYSGYPDCRPEYLEAFQALANLATQAGVEGRGVQILAPLMKLSKAQIVERAEELKVDLSRTVSCYQAADSGQVCGICDACQLRAKGFAEAGRVDPALHRS
jgi:7-cyano-7-deazaguanine synthase